MGKNLTISAQSAKPSARANSSKSLTSLPAISTSFLEGFIDIGLTFVIMASPTLYGLSDTVRGFSHQIKAVEPIRQRPPLSARIVFFFAPLFTASMKRFLNDKIGIVLFFID